MRDQTGIHLKETVIDGISYLCPTWEQMGEFTFILAHQIIESGERFDRVVALAKGGWTWARTLVDYLDIDQISSARIVRYEGPNKAGETKITQPLQDNLSGERILIFDEVNDHGDTLVEAIKHVKENGATEVKTATLCYKPYSKLKSDYFAFKTDEFGEEGSWVVFPHEVREFSVQVAKQWKSKGTSQEEVLKRLTEIGLPLDQSEYFVKKHWNEL